MPLSRMLNSTFAMPNIIDSHDMGLRTVLQSRRPKVNAYSTKYCVLTQRFLKLQSADPWGVSGVSHVMLKFCSFIDSERPRGKFKDVSYKNRSRSCPQ
ncbi:hypothetical protein TNCV_2639111 [Trichonephila clavipes]|nr:hypothetical protein TNCV_2639111 [Trichonephila clavipes]